MLILVLAGATIIGLIKVYSGKPQDSEGRIILSLSDRVVGFAVLGLAIAGIVFVKIDQYGIGNPLILLSPILIGAYVIYNRVKRANKRNKK